MITCDLSVETVQGVCDLDRVVGVLALLDLTPIELCSLRRGGGLSVKVRLAAAERTVDLCLARLRTLPCVTRVDLDIAPSET